MQLRNTSLSTGRAVTDRPRALRLLGVLAASCAVGLVAAQESSTRQLMRAKQDYAHRLLDAVVQQDFAAVQDQAFRLKAVAETADWNVVDTTAYARRSDAFVRAAERLRAAGDAENRDEVLTAFLDLTRSCAGCHDYVRTLTP